MAAKVDTRGQGCPWHDKGNHDHNEGMRFRDEDKEAVRQKGSAEGNFSLEPSQQLLVPPHQAHDHETRVSHMKQLAELLKKTDDEKKDERIGVDSKSHHDIASSNRGQFSNSICVFFLYVLTYMFFRVYVLGSKSKHKHLLELGIAYLFLVVHCLCDCVVSQPYLFPFRW